jgi:hypothetical protein
MEARLLVYVVRASNFEPMSVVREYFCITVARCVIKGFGHFARRPGCLLAIGCAGGEYSVHLVHVAHACAVRAECVAAAVPAVLMSDCTHVKSCLLLLLLMLLLLLLMLPSHAPAGAPPYMSTICCYSDMGAMPSTYC